MGLFTIQSDLQFRVSNHDKPCASSWRARKEDVSKAGRGSGRAVNRAHCFHWLSPRQGRTGGLPWWSSGEEPAFQHRCDPWVGKVPWRREGPPTPVFWPGESHGLYSPWGRKEADTTERLSLTFWNSLMWILLCYTHSHSLSYSNFTTKRGMVASFLRVPGWGWDELGGWD